MVIPVIQNTAKSAKILSSLFRISLFPSPRFPDAAGAQLENELILLSGRDSSTGKCLSLCEWMTYNAVIQLNCKTTYPHIIQETLVYVVTYVQEFIWSRVFNFKQNLGRLKKTQFSVWWPLWKVLSFKFNEFKMFLKDKI